MDLNINEQELYKKKSEMFQKELNELSEKYGLFLMPNISIVPKQEEKLEPIIK